jgi:ABC-2 type transport system permease protein
MSAVTDTIGSYTERPARRSSPLMRLTITEAKLFLREGAGPICGLVIPIILIVVFGSIRAISQPNAALGGRPLLYLYVPVVIFLAMTLICLVTGASTLTGYRERGILRRLALTPAGTTRLLAAQLIVNAGMALTMTVVIDVIAGLEYHVPLPGQFLGYAAVILLTMAALLSLGLCVASVARTTRMAQAMGGLLFYPMMFFSGLWVPLPNMSPLLQHISEATPLGAASAAMAGILGGNFPPLLYIGILAVWAVGGAVLARRMFRWD